MGDAVARGGEPSVSLRSDLRVGGLCRRLMEVLPAEADARGFETVYGISLADNAALTAPIRQLGVDVERDPDDRPRGQATRQRAASASAAAAQATRRMAPAPSLVSIARMRSQRTV